MNPFKKHLRRFSCYFSITSCLFFIGCDGDSSDGATFQAGFNPQSLRANGQVWSVNNSKNTNFVIVIVSDSVSNYRYTTNGQTTTADGINYSYTSLGTSATFNSSFTFTGDQTVLNTLTTQLGNSSSALSSAVAAFDPANSASASAVIKAAGDAVPNLILFFENGNFYTLDSFQLEVNNDGSGRETLRGSPIVFSSSMATQGTTPEVSRISSVAVSYPFPNLPTLP